MSYYDRMIAKFTESYQAKIEQGDTKGAMEDFKELNNYKEMKKLYPQLDV